MTWSWIWTNRCIYRPLTKRRPHRHADTGNGACAPVVVSEPQCTARGTMRVGALAFQVVPRGDTVSGVSGGLTTSTVGDRCQARQKMSAEHPSVRHLTISPDAPHRRVTRISTRKTRQGEARAGNGTAAAVVRASVVATVAVRSGPRPLRPLAGRRRPLALCHRQLWGHPGRGAATTREPRQPPPASHPVATRAAAGP